MATKVKVEGEELIIRNDSGDMAIIPKTLTSRVQKLLEVGNYEEIDNIVNSLPSSSDYAEDGSLYVGDPPIDPPTEKTVIDQGRELDPYQIQAAQKSFGASYDYITESLGETANTLEDRDRGYGFNAQRNDAFTKTFNKSIVDKTPYSGTGEEIMFSLNPGRDMVVDKSNPNISPSLKPGGRGYAVSVNAYKTNPGAYSDVINSTAGLDQFNEYIGVNQKAKGGYIKAEKGLVVGGKKKREAETQQRFEESQKSQVGLFDKIKGFVKGKPTELGTPEVSNEPITEEEMYPSIQKFGKEEIAIPDITTTEKLQKSRTTEIYKQSDLREERFGTDNEYTPTVPTFGEFKCHGSACRSADYEFKDNPYYGPKGFLRKIGLTKAETAGGIDTKNAIDAWDIHNVIRNLGESEDIGENVFNITSKDFNDYENDARTAKKLEFSKDLGENIFAPGDFIGTGNAINAGYVDKESSTVIGRVGKKDVIEKNDFVKPQHSMRVLKYSDETNEDDTRDIYIKDLDHRIRVGTGPKAEMTQQEFFNNKNITAVSRLKEFEGYTNDKFTEVQKHNRAIAEYKKGTAKK